jgi:hypothetical protein
MATLPEERAAAGATRESGQPTGTAAAAFLAAAIGSFGMGLIMILSESGLVSIPALYEPAGGVTGRTTLAVVVRWRGRDVSVSRLAAIIAVLIGLGILGTFPPVWGLL